MEMILGIVAIPFFIKFIVWLDDDTDELYDDEL